MFEGVPCVGKVMALANAADNGQWDEVQRLLRAGPRLSLPQGPNCPKLVRVSRIRVLKLVLGLSERNSEGNCQRPRGVGTLHCDLHHYGSAASAQQPSPNCKSSPPKSLFVEGSGPTGVGVETVRWWAFPDPPPMAHP